MLRIQSSRLVRLIKYKLSYCEPTKFFSLTFSTKINDGSVWKFMYFLRETIFRKVLIHIWMICSDVNVPAIQRQQKICGDISVQNNHSRDVEE